MEKNLFTTRIATLADIPELTQLYLDTILTINKKDYSAEEAEDWASCGNNPKRWEELISNLHFIVAENSEKQIVGFASIRNDGYLHSMYVHKDYQKQGVASLLYKEMEEFAHTNHLTKITSEVSITAKGFFEKLGFKTIEEQKRKANQLYLTNYKMSKNLIE